MQNPFAVSSTFLSYRQSYHFPSTLSIRPSLSARCDHARLHLFTYTVSSLGCRLWTVRALPLASSPWRPCPPIPKAPIPFSSAPYGKGFPSMLLLGLTRVAARLPGSFRDGPTRGTLSLACCCAVAFALLLDAAALDELLPLLFALLLFVFELGLSSDEAGF